MIQLEYTHVVVGSAWCWFNNVAGAHRAIYFQLPCNVYAEVQ